METIRQIRKKISQRGLRRNSSKSDHKTFEIDKEETSQISPFANKMPPEVLTKIFILLPVEDCLNLAQTCTHINEVSNIDFIWENKMLEDFGIDVKTLNCQSRPSARIFYQKVLFKYGNLLGMWQVSSYGHHGGLFQVSKQLSPANFCLI